MGGIISVQGIAQALCHRSVVPPSQIFICLNVVLVYLDTLAALNTSNLTQTHS